MTVTAEGSGEQAEATFDKRVAQFIQVRDAIKAIEEELKKRIAPLQEVKDMLEGWLIKHLETIGVESARTKHGTCTASVKYSAPLADPDMFMSWVIDNKQFEMIDRRANVTAVKAYIEENQTAPPGVNWSSYKSVGVQRPRKKSVHLTPDES